VNADGRVDFEAIPAGTYVLLSSAAGMEGEMEVAVTDDMTVGFDPKPYTCILVGIQSADSPLAQAGFRNADRIVSVNGEEVPRGRSTIYELIKRMRRSDMDIACEVLRGDEKLRIQVAASTFRQDDLQGWLSPAPR